MRRKLTAAAVAAVAALALLPAATHAATITVTTTADVSGDDGVCSLREAITAANTDAATGGCPAGSGADEIILPAGTYVRTALVTSLIISSEVAITGAGAGTTAIDGGGIGPVINNTGILTISEVSLQNGKRVRPEPGAGGIHNVGTLNVINSTITGNAVVRSSSFFRPVGGGIYSTGPTTIQNSTINDNSATANPPVGMAGGVFIDAGVGDSIAITGTTISGNEGGGMAVLGFEAGQSGVVNVSISNSTFSGNTGAGISVEAACCQAGQLTVEVSNSTISSHGSGIRASGSPVNSAYASIFLKNTIVANRPFDNCSIGAGGLITSRGYNISDQPHFDCQFGGSGDMEDTQPLLGPLADNSGPTKTHALLFGSPAIDAGNPAAPGSGGNACEPTDQRGVPRPQDGNGDLSAVCDIGSFEVASDMLPVPGDMEGDDVPDAVDNCPTVQNTGQADGDVDTVGDVCDNCPATANSNQANADGDPPGDVCDNCPNAFNPGQQNNVHPATPAGDHCDDPEPDGVPDLSDNCPDTANAGQENTDEELSAGGASIAGDADGDACDADDDNDGWSDDAEATIGTNPLDNCAGGPGSGGDSWPPDVTADGFVDTGDIGRITNDFADAVPADAPPRHDIGPDPPDGFIDTGDIGRVTNLFGQGCT